MDAVLGLPWQQANLRNTAAASTRKLQTALSRPTSAAAQGAEEHVNTTCHLQQQYSYDTHRSIISRGRSITGVAHTRSTLYATTHYNNKATPPTPRPAHPAMHEHEYPPPPLDISH